MVVTEEDKKRFFRRISLLFEEQLPFNRLLGMRVASVAEDQASVIFDRRDDLIGNVFHQTLHGGVISSVLDTVGGLTALASLVERAAGLPEEKLVAIFSRTGTIDIRVDYLRPGRGDRFTGNAWIMRSGRKVAVTRMELHADSGLLVAVGTGTYMVG
ncbi:conserved hypothetical protein [Desulfosarcina cetonica]|uniref:thioesterase family protein n=1 Tax=Desulfosarcina cetonica TaxID=90730 RepID=UPI000A8BA0C6|nr:thioesterase family protein [Desulfosarcina cetonica]VTR69493.1 conserved hypothetical protein [Desulfosarcina cetonica]